MKNNKTWIIVGMIIMVVMMIQGENEGKKMATTTCYQENADTSYAGDGTCALDYTGSYTCSGQWKGGKPCTKFYDGDWTSGTEARSTDFPSSISFQYKKPIDSLPSSKIKHHIGDVTTESSIPVECWDYDTNTLFFSITSNKLVSLGILKCQGSSRWETVSVQSSPFIYEEAMQWEIGVAKTCTDTFQNKDETDVDCGGTICSPCDLGQSCSINNDCVSNNCDAGTCAIIPSCDVTFSETINYLNKWVGCGVDPCT